MGSEHDRQMENERHINTVLQALCHAEPDSAMQDRLRKALCHAELPTARSVTRQWMPTGLTLRAATPWLAVAATLLLAVGSTLLPHRAAFLRNTPGQQIVTASVSPVFRTHEATEPNAMAAITQVRPAPTRQPVFLTGTSHALSRSRSILSAQDTADSSPPPEPLTEQERLLLRLVRKEQRHELTQLTAVAVDLRQQHGIEAVTEFFAPRPPLRSQEP